MQRIAPNAAAISRSVRRCTCTRGTGVAGSAWSSAPTSCCDAVGWPVQDNRRYSASERTRRGARRSRERGGWRPSGYGANARKPSHGPCATAIPRFLRHKSFRTWSSRSGVPRGEKPFESPQVVPYHRLEQRAAPVRDGLAKLPDAPRGQDVAYHGTALHLISTPSRAPSSSWWLSCAFSPFSPFMLAAGAEETAGGQGGWITRNGGQAPARGGARRVCGTDPAR